MAAVGVKGLSYYVNDNALLWQPQPTSTSHVCTALSADFIHLSVTRQ